MDSLTPDQKSKAENLISLGLPEGQALQSVKADVEGPNPTGSPCHCYAMFVLNEDADVAVVEGALKEYAENSKKCPGKISATYGFSDGQITFHEVYDSPNAMDIHIGNCFPPYSKMAPMAPMQELIAVVDPKQKEWWVKSLGAWGAKKFVIHAAV